jgi:hypothetical protein
MKKYYYFDNDIRDVLKELAECISKVREDKTTPMPLLEKLSFIEKNYRTPEDIIKLKENGRSFNDIIYATYPSATSEVNTISALIDKLDKLINN